MTETLEEEEDKKLKSFLAKAIRPWKGAYEDVLVHTLFLSVGAEPLRSIQLITKAALMFTPEELKKMGIDPELVDVLNVVSTSLANKVSLKGYDDYEPKVSIPWGFKFNMENIRKYIFPWFVVGVEFFRDEFEKFKETYFKTEPETEEEKEAREFFLQTRVLSLVGYYRLVSAFIAWALPKAQEILAKLVEALPSAKYSQLLEAAFSTQKQQEKQGKGGVFP